MRLAQGKCLEVYNVCVALVKFVDVAKILEAITELFMKKGVLLG